MTSTSAGREPSPELKACPFCGEQPKKWRAIHVACRTHMCVLEGIDIEIEAWNRRPPVVSGPDPRAQGLIDAIDGIEQGKGVGEPPEQSQADHPGLLREGHLPQGETRAHCGSGARESGIETRSPTSSSPQSIARGPDQELRDAGQRAINVLADLTTPHAKARELALRALRLALSGTTKEGDPHVAAVKAALVARCNRLFDALLVFADAEVVLAKGGATHFEPRHRALSALGTGLRREDLQRAKAALSENPADYDGWWYDAAPAVSGEPRIGIPRCAMCGHDQEVHNWVPLAGGCSIIGCTCLRFAAIRAPAPTSEGPPLLSGNAQQVLAKLLAASMAEPDHMSRAAYILKYWAGSEGPLPHSPPCAVCGKPMLYIPSKVEGAAQFCCTVEHGGLPSVPDPEKR